MISRTDRLHRVLVLAILVLAAPAWAADSPLAVVPASSPIVLQLHGLDRTKERLIATATAALPDVGKTLEQHINSALQNLPDGRQLKGLVKDGPIFISFAKFPSPEAQPEDFGLAVAVKVTDFSAFRDGLLTKEEKESIKKDGELEKFTAGDHEHYLLKVRDFAVIATNKETATAYQKNAKGLDSKMDQHLAAKFLAADAAAYLSVEELNEQYGTQIKALLEQVTQLADSGAFGSSVDKNNVEMMKKFCQALGRFLDDGRGVVLAVEARPDSVHVGFHAAVTAASKSGELLKSFKTASAEDLSKMPSGYMSYSAAVVTPELLRTLPLLFGIVGGGDDEHGKSIKLAVDKLIEAGPQLQLQASRIPAGGIQVWKFQDPNKASAAQLELFRALAASGTVAGTPIKGKPDIKTDAQSHRGFKFHSLDVRFDLDKLIENLPEGARDAMKKYMKQMVGEEVHIWFGTDGKQFVILTSKDWDAASKSLDAYLDGSKTLAQDQDFQAARGRLSREATFLTVADATQILPILGQFMLAGVIEALGGQGEVREVKPATPGKPAYFGFSLTIENERASFDLDLSVAAVKEFYKMSEPLIKAIRERTGE